MTLPHGLLLVATVNGVPLGCGALKLHPDTATAEVKRMWTSPDARGLGIGRRLLARLEQEAADRNISTLRLETNRALVEAIAMYEHSGSAESRRSTTSRTPITGSKSPSAAVL